MNIKSFSVYFLLFIFAAIIFSSCVSTTILKRDLAFTVGAEFVPRGDTCWFKAKPNMDVTIDSIAAILKEYNYTYTVHNPNQSVIYYANQYFWIDWFNKVTRGEVWEFIFYGKYPYGKKENFEGKTAFVVQ